MILKIKQTYKNIIFCFYNDLDKKENYEQGKAKEFGKYIRN